MLRDMQLKHPSFLLRLPQGHFDPEPIDAIRVVVRRSPARSAVRAGSLRDLQVAVVLTGLQRRGVHGFVGPGPCGFCWWGARGVVVEEETSELGLGERGGADSAGFRREVGWGVRGGQFDAKIMLRVGARVHGVVIGGADRRPAKLDSEDGTGARVAGLFAVVAWSEKTAVLGFGADRRGAHVARAGTAWGGQRDKVLQSSGGVVKGLLGTL